MILKRLTTIAQMRDEVRAMRRVGQRIGFVPTMGSLHDGHLALVQLAAAHADRVVVSIFVNPTQFDRADDLANYPRDLAADEALLASLGPATPAVVFAPAASEMYPHGDPVTRVRVTGLAQRLEGAARPGHFDGVATVVTKLLSIVTPDIAVFGRKDYQQLQVIRRLVADLDLPVEVLAAPTVREADGLAWSSRNRLLDAAGRRDAAALPQALRTAVDTARRLRADEQAVTPEALEIAVRDALSRDPNLRLDRLDIVDADSLDAPAARTRRLAVLVAAFVGSVRLIDNVVVGDLDDEARLLTATEPLSAADQPATRAPAEPPTSSAHGSVVAGVGVVAPARLAAEGRAVVARALAEDLSDVGDVTSQATIPAEVQGTARLVARADGVVAGTDLVAEVYAALDPAVRVTIDVEDGARVVTGQVLGEVAGPLRSILTGERTALNLVTHLSGIATATRAMVDAIEGTGAVIRDTRKTAPGLRLLEKAAVAAGGGVNHRIGLFDALLVKDNHVAVAGSITAAVEAALAHADGRPVQVEVDDLGQLDEALAAGARDILLDNFDLDMTRAAVARVRELEDTIGPVQLETSGTVSHATVRGYADAGVDRIAVGAITHSAPQLDLALDVAVVA